MIQINRGERWLRKSNSILLEMSHVFVETAGDSGVLIDRELRGQRGSEDQPL